MKFIKICWTVL